jgi:hypothetical protein
MHCTAAEEGQRRAHLAARIVGNNSGPEVGVNFLQLPLQGVQVIKR